MTRKRIGIIAGVAATTVAVFAAALWPTAVDVEAALVRRDTLRVSVVAEGQTRLRDRFTVAAPVGGRLQRMEIREGHGVARGEIVARLDPAPDDARTYATARARLTAAQARRQQAAEQLAMFESEGEQATRVAERRRALAAAGAVSDESREQSDLAAVTARRQVEAARSALGAAEADVAAARGALIGASGGQSAGAMAVRSPVAGRVLRVLEPSERVVLAGAPLLELGNIEGLEVVVDVLSQDAARIEAGGPLYLSDWGGDEILTGRVRTVEPAAFTKISALGVEEQRVNVIGDLDAPPPSLGAGFRVEARIVTWTGTDVLLVPTSALFQDGQGWQVFVIEGGRARRRSVRLGHRGEAAAEVTAGLEPGEQVILYPSDQIQAGLRVRPTLAAIRR